MYKKNKHLVKVSKYNLVFFCEMIFFETMNKNIFYV